MLFGLVWRLAVGLAHRLGRWVRRRLRNLGKAFHRLSISQWPRRFAEYMRPVPEPAASANGKYANSKAWTIQRIDFRIVYRTTVGLFGRGGGRSVLAAGELLERKNPTKTTAIIASAPASPNNGGSPMAVTIEAHIPFPMTIKTSAKNVRSHPGRRFSRSMTPPRKLRQVSHQV